MTRQIRRLGIAFIVCYVALFAMVNYWQVIAADELRANPDNTRGILRDFNRPRGTIETADGVLLARTVETGGEELQYQREYPEGERYGHLTGWFSLELGASGIEREYNDELAGNTVPLQIRSFGDLFVDHDTTGDVILSIEDSVQQVAETALGDREGSVVALDPRSGEILALWSFPSYDPNPLSSHDIEAATAAKDALEEAPGDPLLAHAYQERYFPGSTFKVVTAGAGLQSGRVTVTEPNYPPSSAYVPPQTTVAIHNFDNGTCGGTLVPIMQRSCNTAFAEMAAETLGPEIMIEGAESFGFNSAPPIDLPDPATSVFPTNFDQNLPALVQSGIGQNEVQGTPLQMALVAAAVANDGEIMRPTVMQEVRASDGDIVDRADEGVWRDVLDGDEVAALQEAMVATVEGGTAGSLAIPGMVVGGKTGTAEIGLGTDETHAWIIGYAGPPGEEARVAVAVLVEARPGQGTQSGGTVAGPVVREAVLEAALAVSEADGDEADGGPGSDDTRPTTPATTPSDGPATTRPAAPTTVPPATLPATTAPLATLPPVTEPPATAPTTGPPATGPPSTGP